MQKLSRNEFVRNLVNYGQSINITTEIIIDMYKKLCSSEDFGHLGNLKNL